LVITLVSYLLTPYLYHMPKAVMASIIYAALGGMMHFKEGYALLKISHSEFMLWCVAFLCTTFLGVSYGLIFSVLAAMGVLLIDQAKPKMRALGRLPGTDQYRDIKSFENAEAVPGVLILSMGAPIHFANKDHIDVKMNKWLNRYEDTKHVVLDCRAVTRVDSTGVKMLADLSTTLKERGITLYFAAWQGTLNKFEKLGFHEKVGLDQFYLSVHGAVTAISDKSKKGGTSSEITTPVVQVRSIPKQETSDKEQDISDSKESVQGPEEEQ
jgi:anti-anti-sigma factor